MSLASKILELTKSSQEYVKITITARDGEGILPELLEYIKDTGNVGHSFDIVVDPDDSDTTKKFGWDGDGVDMIKSIKVEKISSI